VEISDVVTASAALVPLAGPANRQAPHRRRVHRRTCNRIRGVQGTAVCGVLGLTSRPPAHRRSPCAGPAWRFFRLYTCIPVITSATTREQSQSISSCSFARRTAAFWGAQRQWVRPASSDESTPLRWRSRCAHSDDLAEAELCYAPQLWRGQGPGEPGRHESRRTPATKIRLWRAGPKSTARTC